MSAAHVAEARTRLAAWIGVDLGRGGIARAVERHVEARVRALGDPAPRVYGASLDEPGSSEARLLIEAATVPHSWLFRDPAQLAAVSRVLERRPRGRLRAWVAGCAEGEDAVTFAILALRAGHDVHVLATDVNATALSRAAEATFGAFSCRELPANARRFFREGPGGAMVAVPLVRERITFARHSLVEPPPKAQDGRAFDLVVCRNVLIYFARDHACSIVARLRDALADGGHLVLGASDVLADLPHGLSPDADAGRLVLERRSCSPPAPRVIPVEVRGPVVDLPPPAPTAPSASPPLRDALHEVLDRGDMAATRALAEERCARDPHDLEARLALGLAHHAASDYRRAVEHLLVVCRSAPGAWVGWLHLGFANERLGRFDEARRAFQRVPLATGPGEDLPRGEGELSSALHAARTDLVRLALRRAATLENDERRNR